MAKSIEELLVDAARSTQDTIRAAFDLGRQAGAAEARAEMKARLAAVVDGTNQEQVATETRTASQYAPTASTSADRTERGTVQPAMEAVMIEAKRGLTQREVYERLQVAGHRSIKESTTRSQLNKWRAEGKAHKVGSLWHLIVPQNKTTEGTEPKQINGGSRSPHPLI